MDTGTLKTKNEKGFGFITPANGGADVFFHLSACVNDGGFDALNIGDQVTFKMGMGPKGPKAEEVNLAA